MKFTEVPIGADFCFNSEAPYRIACGIKCTRKKTSSNVAIVISNPDEYRNKVGTKITYRLSLDDECTVIRNVSLIGERL